MIVVCCEADFCYVNFVVAGRISHYVHAGLVLQSDAEHSSLLMRPGIVEKK
jgi:hypothetical protein